MVETMKVGVLGGGNCRVVAERKTWEGLAVHLHQLHPRNMTPVFTHMWLVVAQVVGS